MQYALRATLFNRRFKRPMVSVRAPPKKPSLPYLTVKSDLALLICQWLTSGTIEA